MTDECRTVLMELMKAVCDKQRRTLHDRINWIVRFSNESDKSDFVIEIMRDLPYPDFKQLLITFFEADKKKDVKIV